MIVRRLAILINDSIREFALNVFILGDRNVYQFMRLNISGFLPSLTVIQCSLDSERAIASKKLLLEIHMRLFMGFFC